MCDSPSPADNYLQNETSLGRLGRLARRLANSRQKPLPLGFGVVTAIRVAIEHTPLALEISGFVTAGHRVFDGGVDTLDGGGSAGWKGCVWMVV